MKTEEVAIKPKLSKKRKAREHKKANHDFFFDHATDFWLAEQEKNKARNKWYGWVSPSAQWSWDMCMEEFFEERVHKFLEFQTPGLYSVRMGGIIHTGMTDAFSHIPDLRYGEPHYKDPEAEKWYQEKCKPEFAIWCRKTGLKGKVDFIVRKNDRPAVIDLKNTWKDQKYWREIILKDQIVDRPKVSDIIQICYYAHVINSEAMFDKKVRECAVAYVNNMEKPFTKHWSRVIWIDYWNDYRERTAELVNAVGIGWRSFKRTGTSKCRNQECRIHGSA